MKKLVSISFIFPDTGDDERIDDQLKSIIFIMREAVRRNPGETWRLTLQAGEKLEFLDAE